METKERLEEAGEFLRKLASDAVFCNSLQVAASLMSSTFGGGNKVLIFGNGGSAGHAQHLSAELVGRFKKTRRALPAIALTTDTSILTPQANDAGYHTIFSRQIEALCHPGDVAIAITTSDSYGQHSANIVHGLEAAKEAGAQTIGLFSQKTKALLRLTDVPIIVPHTDTSLIQLVHQHIVHELCELIEERL